MVFITTRNHVFLLFFVCLVIPIGLTQQTTADLCQALTECLQKVDDKEAECTALSKPTEQTDTSTDQPAANGTRQAARQHYKACMIEVKSSVLTLRSLQHRKREVFQDCITSKAPAAPELNRRKAAKCQRVSQRLAADRVTRQTPDADRESRPKAVRRRNKQAARRRKKQQRRQRKKNRPVKTCLKEARKMKKTCRPLLKCCTAVRSCKADFELSELHDQLKREQRTMKQKKKDCKRQKMAKNKKNRRRGKGKRNKGESRKLF